MMPCNYNYELGQYLKREEESQMNAETRDAMIEESAQDLMTEVESCFPYGITIYANVPHTYYNLFEALGDIPEPQQKVLSEQWREAAGKGDGYMNLKSNLFDQLDKIVREYWLRQAKHIVEKEYE